MSSVNVGHHHEHTREVGVPALTAIRMNGAGVRQEAAATVTLISAFSARTAMAHYKLKKRSNSSGSARTHLKKGYHWQLVVRAPRATGSAPFTQ